MRSERTVTSRGCSGCGLGFGTYAMPLTRGMTALYGFDFFIDAARSARW